MAEIISGTVKVIVDACFKAGYDKGYQQGRADAIDELLKAITDNSYRIEEDYTVGEFARVCIWEDDLQKIAEQIKEQKNE